MLKAKSVDAISLALTDGINAVLVKVGDDWNGISEYRCVSPQAFLGCMMLVIQSPESLRRGRFVAFGIEDRREFEIVAASPDLSAAIKAIEAAEAAEKKAT